MTSASVIIPVYNDWARLRFCLEALQPQVTGVGAWEVLIVDNGSDDDGAPVLSEFPWVRLLRNEKPGSYAARNSGIRHARGDILAFTDADCLPGPEWLRKGTEYLDSHEGVSLAAGRVEVFAANPRKPRMAEVYEILNAFPQEQYAHEHGFAATANLFVRKEVVTAVGPFLEDVMSGGDKEFGQRAARAGFTIGYAPEAVVRHPARPTIRLLSRKNKRTLAGIRDLQRLKGRDAAVHNPAPIARSLVPPVPSILGALRDDRLERRWIRCKYALAVAILHYVRVWIRFRLILGARSPR